MLKCLVHRSADDDVYVQVHFTESDYPDWFLRYKQFCTGQYL